MDNSEMFHTSLNFEARNQQVTWTGKCPCKNKQLKSENDDVYLFYFEILQLEIWHACSYSIILFQETCRLYILHILFDFLGVPRMKPVGSVFSRSKLDPFLYICQVSYISNPKRAYIPLWLVYWVLNLIVSQIWGIFNR